MTHKKRDKIDLSALRIDIEISGTNQLLRLTRKDEPPYSYSFTYEFVADFRCNEIVDGVLRIHLEPNIVREYGVQFEEGVNREVAYHLGFKT